MNWSWVLLLAVPTVIPALMGYYLLRRKSDALGWMAGLLSMKPVITTPLWFGMIALLAPPRSFGTLEPVHFLSILPGAGLTLAIAIVYRRLLSGPTAPVAWTLLVIDCARWLNSFFIYLPIGDGSLNCLSALCGLAMPTVFATIALAAVLSRTKD
jgi:hypothetical protein